MCGLCSLGSKFQFSLTFAWACWLTLSSRHSIAARAGGWLRNTETLHMLLLHDCCVCMQWNDFRRSSWVGGHGCWMSLWHILVTTDSG